MIAAAERALANREVARQPLFVVGSARSGTTMVARALAASPELCYLGESLAFAVVVPSGVGWRRLIRLCAGDRYLLRLVLMLKAKDRVRGLDRMPGFVERGLLFAKIPNEKITGRSGSPLDKELGLTLGKAELELRDALVVKYRVLFAEDPLRAMAVAYKDFEILSGRQRILEKTPFHCMQLPWIFRVFPDARVVFTKREDYRSILSSFWLMLRSKGKTRELARSLARIDAYRQAAVSGYPTRVFVAEFGEILENPGEVLPKIFRFAGVDFPERLGPVIEDIAPRPSKYGKLDPAVKSFVDEWASKLERGLL